MRCLSRRSVIAAGLGLAGCAAMDRARLGVLYETMSWPADHPPLILIPGAFGSSLRDRRSGRELWPVSDSKLLLGNYRELELPLDPGTLEPDASRAEAFAVFREGLGRDFYGGLIDALERVGGYGRCPERTNRSAGTPCSLYVFLYDFRLDNVRAARGLAALIERVRLEHGDPRLRVDVVAHSNGGLVARYFIRHGTAGLSSSVAEDPTFAGAQAIRRLLLVGTPNLGTLQSVLSLLRGEEIGLRRIPPEVIATSPGITQFMPHPCVPWLVDLQGSRIDANLYDVATWRDFGWSLFDPRIAARTVANHGAGKTGLRYLEMLRESMALNLANGKAFANSFASRPDSRDVPTWVFGGDCAPTLARLVLESVDGHTHARGSPDAIAGPGPHDYAALMFEPGDSVVTRSSLLGRRTLDIASPRATEESLHVAHSLFFCERHQQLAGNRSLQDNLLNALFSVDAT